MVNTSQGQVWDSTAGPGPGEVRNPSELPQLLPRAQELRAGGMWGPERPSSRTKAGWGRPGQRPESLRALCAEPRLGPAWGLRLPQRPPGAGAVPVPREKEGELVQQILEKLRILNKRLGEKERKTQTLLSSSMVNCDPHLLRNNFQLGEIDQSHLPLVWGERCSESLGSSGSFCFTSEKTRKQLSWESSTGGKGIVGNCSVPPQRLCCVQSRGRAAARVNCCGCEINGILLPELGMAPGEGLDCAGHVQSLSARPELPLGSVPTPALSRAQMYKGSNP